MLQYTQNSGVILDDAIINNVIDGIDGNNDVMSRFTCGSVEGLNADSGVLFRSTSPGS